ncbi:hypothetical protein ACP70R_038384 [Stipagrostis hirtigluma subsp. patula]
MEHVIEKGQIAQETNTAASAKPKEATHKCGCQCHEIEVAQAKPKTPGVEKKGSQATAIKKPKHVTFVGLEKDSEIKAAEGGAKRPKPANAEIALQTTKAKPQEPNHVVFIDLERGHGTGGGGVDQDEPLHPATCYANLCLLVLFFLLVIATALCFMKMPLGLASLITFFIGSNCFLIYLCVITARDYYIEKDMAENDQASN